MAAVPLLNGSSSSIDEDFDTSEKLSRLQTRRKPFSRKEKIGFAILGCCLLAITVGLSTGVAILVVLGWQNRGGDACFRKSSMPSPVTQDFDITYHTQHYNGSFMQENVYRQKAGPEVDAAWDALGVNYRAALIPADVGPHVGLTSDHVQISSKYGGGYPANVEGLHHLHCLNLLRQGLYYNVEYYRKKGEGAFINEESIVQLHVSHCLDIIRQQLMCTVDVGVLGQVWYRATEDDAPTAFVDFNTKHTCRNYDDIRRWAEERQLPEDIPDDFLQVPTPNTKILDHVP